jgi:beta-phosphoglucomutase-like phosphatase (HAD superfamily)
MRRRDRMVRDPDPYWFIFDCDGTLFDTEPLKARSWGQAYVHAIRTAIDKILPNLEAGVAKTYRSGGATEAVAKAIIQKCEAQIREAVRAGLESIRDEELMKARKDAKHRIFNEIYDELEQMSPDDILQLLPSGD